ncbi:hypothetical protein J2T02_003264 [Chitinophaga terrae (ex Kim and Jung 2007)]|jgi:hypothetical protein|nr:hypothetical protein [Chitinophaga terrae (ex Kim and Jung 2007)]MDQ0108136.1 hypothetical protein [Chitinophaga terrae (ex Kim and Jung 2007)]
MKNYKCFGCNRTFEGSRDIIKPYATVFQKYTDYADEIERFYQEQMR